MIRTVTLERFKTFHSQTFELAPLTMLSGINSMGKSSFIQALLMMWEATRAAGSMGEIRTLSLKGNYYSLGTAADALFCDAEEDSFRIAIQNDDSGIATIEADCSSQTVAELPCEVTAQNGQHLAGTGKDCQFHYLCADRLGPQLALANPPMSESGMGKSGEFIGHFLLQNENKKVIEALRHPRAVSDGLKYQLEAWLDIISPGTRILVENHSDINQTSLRFEFQGDKLTIGPFKAINVGFGISHVLPVLAAVLSSKPGDLIIVDSPESHLHPRGQSMVAQLMSMAASAGIQIIVETHSDHILNGMRISVKTGIIQPELCAFLFFDRSNGATTVDNIKIDQHGRIEDWPEGFFDEWDNSLLKLL